MPPVIVSTSITSCPGVANRSARDHLRHWIVSTDSLHIRAGRICQNLLFKHKQPVLCWRLHKLLLQAGAHGVGGTWLKFL